MLLLSLKKLAEEKSLKSVRLWGKILGTVKNYIIVEGELKDNVNDDEEAAIANGVSANGEEPVLDELEEKNINNGEKQPGEDGGEHDAALPKLKIKTVPPVPREGRNGANKYVYYVCNHGKIVG